MIHISVVAIVVLLFSSSSPSPHVLIGIHAMATTKGTTNAQSWTPTQVANQQQPRNEEERVHRHDNPKPVVVVSVGVAAIDYVATVDQFPKPDAKIRSTSLVVQGGGNAANTASALGRLTPYVTSSKLVTVLGDDDNGNAITQGLSDSLVQVVAEQVLGGTSPFTYILSCQADLTRTCIHQRATADLSQDFVLNHPSAKALWEPTATTAVHFDVRYPQASMAIAKLCRNLGIPYSVDVERPRQGVLELLQGATVVICNAEYCQTVLSSSKDGNSDKPPPEQLRQVMQMQAPHTKVAIQTMGSQGSILICLDETDTRRIAELAGVTMDLDSDPISVDSSLSSPSSPSSWTPPQVKVTQDGVLTCSVVPNMDVVDTTGAGDAFIGGFLAAYWQQPSRVAEQEGQVGGVGQDPRFLARALRIATWIAAHQISKTGARQGLPWAQHDAWLQAEFQALL